MTKQNPYQLKEVKKLIAPNGRPIVIWSDGDKQYVQLVQIYSALGFNGTFGLDTTLGVIFKNKRFSLLTKQVANNRTSYVTNLDAIIPILESFIRLTLMTTPRAKHNQPIRDNARMEAERLIELFNREVFNKPGTVTVKNAGADTAPTISKELKDFLETEYSYWNVSVNQIPKATIEKLSALEKECGTTNVIDAVYVESEIYHNGVMDFLQNDPDEPAFDYICDFARNPESIGMGYAETKAFNEKYAEEWEKTNQSSTAKASKDYETYLDLLEQKRKQGGKLTYIESSRLVKARPWTNDTTDVISNLIFGDDNPALSKELNDFLKEEVLYIHNYGREKPEELIGGNFYWTDLLPPIAEKLGELEKELGTEQVINSIRLQVQSGSEFRCTLIDMLSCAHTNVYRWQQCQKLIGMIRNKLNRNDSSAKENGQMENTAGMTTVPVITVKDFDDIGERAEAIVRIFGSSKKDALRAAVTLKAEEINRDLTPLHELLA